jgi:hypothetical protein
MPLLYDQQQGLGRTHIDILHLLAALEEWAKLIVSSKKVSPVILSVLTLHHTQLLNSCSKILYISLGLCEFQYLLFYKLRACVTENKSWKRN